MGIVNWSPEKTQAAVGGSLLGVFFLKSLGVTSASDPPAHFAISSFRAVLRLQHQSAMVWQATPRQNKMQSLQGGGTS